MAGWRDSRCASLGFRMPAFAACALVATSRGWVGLRGPCGALGRPTLLEWGESDDDYFAAAHADPIGAVVVVPVGAGRCFEWHGLAARRAVPGLQRCPQEMVCTAPTFTCSGACHVSTFALTSDSRWMPRRREGDTERWQRSGEPPMDRSDEGAAALLNRDLGSAVPAPVSLRIVSASN